MKYLRELGFKKDELQPNSWIRDFYRLYQGIGDEFIFAIFRGDDDVDIIREVSNFESMKPFLCEYFIQEYRENRLSSILNDEKD